MDQGAGGQRDPDNPWDYFNPTADGENRVDDILAVLGRYFHRAGTGSLYSDRYDRTYEGPNEWNLGAASGQILIDDVINALNSYFHDCAAKEPVHTQSVYMQSTNWVQLYDRGSSQATGRGLVILDFGQPWFDPLSSTHGSLLFSDEFAPTRQIRNGVQSFAEGYYHNSPFGFSIRVGIGTNNWNYNYVASPYDHGAAWGEMVNGVNEWILAQDFHEKVTARGANDIETGWASAADTYLWVDGYHFAANWSYYHFGDAGGCPLDPPDEPGPPGGWCDADWYQEQVWWVSSGAPLADVVPDIYYDDLAHQWYALSVYAVLNHGPKIYFSGTMTQWVDAGTRCRPVPIATNKPWEGYSQLLWLLNKDPRTQQELEYSTDIACWEGTWLNYD